MAIDLKLNPLGVNPLKAAGATVAAAGPVAGGKDFLSFVKEAAQNAVATQRKAESASIGGLAGRTDLLDVVSAVSNAETTLQTVVAVRDKLVSAYQELMRMPV
jgi:flagellar hook-basal body complex protein FliE